MREVGSSRVRSGQVRSGWETDRQIPRSASWEEMANQVLGARIILPACLLVYDGKEKMG